MARGKPLSAVERRNIEKAIRDGGTCRGIAKQFKRSPDTIRRVAREAGIESPFARTQTARATQAKQIDNRARRAEISTELHFTVAKVLPRLTKPAYMHGLAMDGTWVSKKVSESIPKDTQHLSSAVAGLIRAIDDLEKIDQGTDTVSDVDAWLKVMTGEK